MENMWSAAGSVMLKRWSPIMSSTYGVNCNGTMFDKVLCVVDNNDMS